MITLSGHTFDVRWEGDATDTNIEQDEAKDETSRGVEEALVLAFLDLGARVAGEMEVVIRQPGRPDRVLSLVMGTHTLGRSDDNHIVLPDIGVSRRHAKVHIGTEGVRIEDVGSGNGTWCRGQRLKPTDVLRSGDIVLIDPFTLEFRAPGKESPRYTPGSIAQRMVAQARLDVVHGPNLAQRSYLITPEGLSLGRSEYRDLVVLDPAASRHHCDVVLRDDRWYLVDNQSSNGVYVNDSRVSEVQLHPGDIVRIGNTELRFERLDDTTEDRSDASPQSGQLNPWDLKTVNEDWSQDLSLPIPEAEAMALLEKTPPSKPPRPPPVQPTPPAAVTAPLTTRRSPWIPLLLGALAAATLALALVATVAIVGVVAAGSMSHHQVTPPRAQLGPTWRLELPPGLPPSQVPTLFDEGVQAMLQQHPRDALERFYRVLLAEPGNPAAERWSVAAGEHLMLQAMHEQLKKRAAERQEREARRDELLERWGNTRFRRRAVEREFEAAGLRDDPKVLTTLGWTPSNAEKELGKRVDTAFDLANRGQLGEAEAAFRGVLATSQNPVVKSRAAVGLQACRDRLSAQAAVTWREGVLAELRGDVDEARQQFRKVLEADPNNPSARAHLSYLGSVGGR